MPVFFIAVSNVTISQLASDLDSRLRCPKQQVVADRSHSQEACYTLYRWLPPGSLALQRAGQKGTSQMWNMSFCPKFPVEDKKVKLRSCSMGATCTPQYRAVMSCHEVFGLSICCLQPCNSRAGSLRLPVTRQEPTPTSLPEEHTGPTTLADTKKQASGVPWDWTLCLEQEGHNHP